VFTPLFIQRGEHSLLFKRMEGQRDNFTPRRQSSPPADNFAPGPGCPWGSMFVPTAEVKNGPLHPKKLLCLSATFLQEVSIDLLPLDECKQKAARYLLLLIAKAGKDDPSSFFPPSVRNQCYLHCRPVAFTVPALHFLTVP
jgi:hypothetical protein